MKNWLWGEGHCHRIEKGIKNNHGRIRKKYFPKMEMTVDGAGPGDEIRIGSKRNVDLDIKIQMNVPISQIRVIAMGETIWSAAPQKNEIKRKINLKFNNDTNYLRLMATETAERNLKEKH